MHMSAGAVGQQVMVLSVTSPAHTATAVPSDPQPSQLQQRGSAPLGPRAQQVPNPPAAQQAKPCGKLPPAPGQQ